MIDHYESLTAAGQEAASAVTKFHKTLSAGLQEITNHFLSLAQSAADANLAVSKAAMEAKSAQELAQLHADWTQRLVSTAVSGSTKLSEITTKVAGDAAAPIGAHFHTTISKLADNVASFSNKAA